MRRRYFVVPALLASTALALSGCSAGTNADSAAADLKVVATTTQVADFTRNVIRGARGVDLTQLIQPNQSAHSYDPSAADLTALGAADVLVINGVGLEEWLDDAIAASGFDGVTIDADKGITISKVGAGEDHSADEQADTHAHDGGDPHIWTDVHNAETIVRTITGGLTAADSDNAPTFTSNAVAYTARLSALDEWIRTNVATVPESDRLLVSNHDALGYFTAAYHIDYVGSVIPSFDDNAEPSAAEIDTLVAAVKATGVTAIFSEASLSPKTAETIATEAGVTVYSGDDALYVDSLGPDGSAGDTYIKAQLHNATLMLQSWGVTPSALPADLQ
ncbi:MAG: metal ABC transporter substrate-binding protein [Cryobacterium sp.]|uniref:metal ABC transporter substrate-binding protein n=1 Tax=unclassified Cryobacterium TaxID=2649013 RepID=UPI0018CB80C1|nr:MULTISPECIES: metal ABC transporter substrate-binding protein [unclassified Cryobacterium]MCY7404195.1 metal ABC transporter substrate-binding protein [Cryobacterium sp.]MEC5153760.1 ABC-type Zn uptake system ZnuABC Zn-binding protein ZnuA [Cryobacterium sp. CAN_C3]